MSHTIKDIALRAGVSKSTVSRVISGKGFVSPQTREKVWNAAKELQYKPNALARAMVSNQTKNIGVIYFRENIHKSSVYERIIESVIQKAKELNYLVFLSTEEENSTQSVDYMLERRVDGLILVGNVSNNVLSYINHFNIPHVLVEGRSENSEIPMITTHDRKGGQSVADFLFQLGHKDILVIVDGKQRSNHIRLKGFVDRMKELGLNIDSSDILYLENTNFHQGYRVLSENWELFSKKKPTALFATDDFLALGMMKFLMEKGVKIPNDVSVVGYNGIDLSEMFHPSLTTVEINYPTIGRDAISHLDQLIKKEKQSFRIEYEPKLVIRESTKHKNL